MARALGEDYEVIEEGLNGRATCWETPIEPGRNGLTYLVPCLLSHAPVDLVIIMLGTNDLKRVFGLGAPEIAGGMARLVNEARQSLTGPDDTPPGVLVVAPVPLGEVTEHSELWGLGEARETSRQLARFYALVAEDYGVGFFDAGTVAAVHPDDGVHLDAEACASLGTAMAAEVRGLLE
jgi:lysophospholipase L1-like esterase